MAPSEPILQSLKFKIWTFDPDKQIDKFFVHKSPKEF